MMPIKSSKKKRQKMKTTVKAAIVALDFSRSLLSTSSDIIESISSTASESRMMEGTSTLSNLILSRGWKPSFSLRLVSRVWSASSSSTLFMSKFVENRFLLLQDPLSAFNRLKQSRHRIPISNTFNRLRHLQSHHVSITYTTWIQWFVRKISIKISFYQESFICKDRFLIVMILQGIGFVCIFNNFLSFFTLKRL